jgi:hypothetical protein
MERKYAVGVRGLGVVYAFATTRHKAKAEIARDLMDRGYPGDFKEVCNRWIYSCRLVRP